MWGFGPVWAKTWSNLGASMVSMGWQDINLGLERGTLDGVPSHWSGSAGAKWYEVADYPIQISLMGGYSSGVLMNRNAWNRLPPDVQAAWTKLSESNEIGMMWAKAVDDKEKDGRQAWKNAGKEIFEMPLAEKERIADRLVAVWKGWIDRNEADGKPAKEIYRTYVELMKKLGQPVLIKLPGLYQ